MKKRKIKLAVLCIIAIILTITSSAVLYVDFLLWSVFQEQQKNKQLLAQASAVPVLQPVYTPLPPVRASLLGDIVDVRFPDYDTGLEAEYSYQTDELRIAVDEIQEGGVTYYVADIWMRNINCFKTAFSSGKFRGKREPAEKIAQDNNAILAVNGDFLGGLVLRNGELFRKATLRAVPFEDGVEQSTNERPQRATCVLYYDGTMLTEEYSKFRSTRAMEQGAWQGWQFGPTLIRNGNVMKDVRTQGRNPRCILGYYEPGHYCLILIDGRRKGHSIGMNMKEMIELCTRLGLKEAYNLDGGGSAIMTFDGKIINQPSGTNESRNLTDMVVIGEYLDPEILSIPASTPTPEIVPAPIDTPEDN